jgi:serine/threonine protein kinase
MNLQHLLALRGGVGPRLGAHQIGEIVGFLVGAYAHLEANRIAHCDIKPENILVLNAKTLEMRLCDVGSSRVVTGESPEEDTVLGTLPFLAPELVSKNHEKALNVFKADVFSFGLVVLYMVTNKKFTSL